MSQTFTFLLQNEFVPKSAYNELGVPYPINVSQMNFNNVCNLQLNLNKNSTYNDRTATFTGHWYSFLYTPANTSKLTTLMSLIDNPFSHHTNKMEALELFCKVQRAYWGFSKLAQIFKHKKAVLRVETDMLLAPIKESDENVFSFVQDANKYLFSQTDITNIFTMGLLNMTFYMLSPNSLKNPYTNACFSISTLYNFYFFLRSRFLRIPLHIELFYQANFDINTFLQRNRAIIQDKGLEVYVNNMPVPEKYSMIQHMIFEYSRIGVVRIHPSFPKEKLVIIMNPYLISYMKGNYSSTRHLLDHYRGLWKRHMKAFFAFNPKFGEMIFLNSFTGESTEGSFNLSYPNFKNISKSSSIAKFMTSHLSVTDCANNVDDILDDIRNQAVGEQEVNEYENRSVQSSTSSDDSDDDIAIITGMTSRQEREQEREDRRQELAEMEVDADEGSEIEF